MIDLKYEGVLSLELFKTSRDVYLVEKEDCSLRRGEPRQYPLVIRPREDPGTVGKKKGWNLEISSQGEKARRVCRVVGRKTNDGHTSFELVRDATACFGNLEMKYNLSCYE